MDGDGDRGFAAARDYAGHVQPPGRAVIRWHTDEFANSRVDYAPTPRRFSAAEAELTDQHEVALEIWCRKNLLLSRHPTDEAGNSATNSGGLLTLTAPGAPPVLIVDGFFDDLFFDPPPLLSRYTDALNQIGVTYDVWDYKQTPTVEVTLADLRPYRVVIWRLPELNFTTYSTLTPGERAAITNYLNRRLAVPPSMEVLTRLGEASAFTFRTNVLKVVGYVGRRERRECHGRERRSDRQRIVLRSRR